MGYAVDVVACEPIVLAVARATVAQPDVPKVLPDLFDRVYRWLATAPVTQAGHNFAIYRRTADMGAMQMDAGVPVSGPFEDGDPILCTTLPRGRALHTKHVGPYSGLPGAHAALFAWRETHALEGADLQWEIYGDWTEDASRLETDVYHLLADRA